MKNVLQSGLHFQTCKMLWHCATRTVYSALYVTQSDKKGLIAGKYICLLNIMYLNCSVSYWNSVNFNKISRNVCISGEGFDVYAKSYKISNFEIMVKFWRAISPFLSERVTYIHVSNPCATYILSVV